MRNLQALLENESLQQQINDLLAQSGPANSSTSAVAIEASVSDQKKAEDRTAQIIAQADKLKREIAAAKKEIADRKAALSRRKSDLTSASDGTEARRSRQLDETERSISVTKYKWNRSADNMATTRAFLCMEAAKLYGLRRIKKGSSARYEYKIGGVDVIDLSSMNGKLLQLDTCCEFLTDPASRVSRDIVHITCQPGPYRRTDVALSLDPPARRDHSSASGLSSSHDLQPRFLLSARRCPISWFFCHPQPNLR